jgi:hypothetical protein
LFCKKITVVKSREVKTGLAESSKEGYGSKTAVLPVIVVMMMMMMMTTSSEKTRKIQMRPML